MPLQRSLIEKEESPKISKPTSPGSQSGDLQEGDRQGARSERRLTFPVAAPPPRRDGHPSAPQKRRRKGGGPRILDSDEAPPRRGRAADRAEGPHLSPSSRPGPGRIAIMKSTPVALLPRGGGGGVG